MSKRIIKSGDLLLEYFKEYDEFDISTFLDFLEDNCEIYLLDDFCRKGSKILKDLGIKTKKLYTIEDLCNAKNLRGIAVYKHGIYKEDD